LIKPQTYEISPIHYSLCIGFCSSTTWVFLGT
jgi:hypothetical protein